MKYPFLTELNVILIGKVEEELKEVLKKLETIESDRVKEKNILTNENKDQQSKILALSTKLDEVFLIVLFI